MEQDSKVTAFLWNIVVGIIETCNEQNLILEGVNLTPKNVRNLLDSKPFAPIKALFLIFSKQYILKHYQNNISVQDIAQAAGISEGHLRKCFKNDFRENKQYFYRLL